MCDRCKQYPCRQILGCDVCDRDRFQQVSGKIIEFVVLATVIMTVFGLILVGVK